jgi:hypothetical protein
LSSVVGDGGPDAVVGAERHNTKTKTQAKRGQGS